MIIDLFEWTLAKIDFDGAESAKKLNMNIIFLLKILGIFKIFLKTVTNF